jgi:hypothetical protein
MSMAKITKPEELGASSTGSEIASRLARASIILFDQAALSATPGVTHRPKVPSSINSSLAAQVRNGPAEDNCGTLLDTTGSLGPGGEAFIDLISMSVSLERMRHMLAPSKPLRT